MATASARSQDEASKFIEFLNGSRSPFHAVANLVGMLKQAGYQPWHDDTELHVQPGQKYYMTRNQSALIAFHVPKEFVLSRDGITAVAAHTDSPVLRLKPKSVQQSSGYLTVGVQTYGGGLWHTWFDRDLTVAGRVIVEHEGTHRAQLVHVPRPLLRIPTLAIHLDRGVSDAFKFNNEEQLVPVLATAVRAALDPEQSGDTDARHHALLIRVLAEQLGCKPEQIREFELCVCDTQPAAVGGALNEFIFSAQLDNLMCSYLAVQALIRAESAESDPNIKLVALFDNEECGSESAQGANSNMLQQVIERTIASLNEQRSNSAELTHITLRKSFLVSADMAHAIHPNYSSKHERNHAPGMQRGPVLKHNPNQRYATTPLTAHLLRLIAEQHRIPVQEFVVRNDSPCGTTIGPILASKLGMRTVDLGLPQLSMHSIREMAAVDDLVHGLDLLQAVYRTFARVDATLVVDKNL